METFLAREMDLRLERLRAAVEEEAMAREEVLIMVCAEICWGAMGGENKRGQGKKAANDAVNVKE